MNVKQHRGQIYARYLFVPIAFVFIGITQWVTYDADYDISFGVEAIDKLVESCGVRLAGTAANEICAVELLADMMRGLGVERENLDIQTSRNGSYYLDFLSGINLAYSEIHNVVVRIPGKKTSAAERGSGACDSILVGSHFDTAFGSPGKSDAGVGIGIMADMVKKLMKDPADVDVIFNFNGAEEVIMQGSHAFITQHKWAKNICGFVNLESGGPMGKAKMFQVNARWILEAYKKSVPWPSLNSMIYVIFLVNVVPADTDFRVYRDYGGIPGCDFANYGQGWRYHTSNDNYHYLPAVRYYGSTIYNLVREMATSVNQKKHLEANQEVLGKLTFFDLLGRWTFIVHVNVFSALAVIILLWQYRERDLRRNVYYPLLTILLSVLLSGIPGWFCYALTMLGGVYIQHAFVVYSNIFTSLFILPALFTSLHFLPEKGSSTMFALLHLLTVAASPKLSLLAPMIMLPALSPPLGFIINLPLFLSIVDLVAHVPNRSGGGIPIMPIVQMTYGCMASMMVMSLGNKWLPKITSRTLYTRLTIAAMCTTVLLSIGLPQYTDEIPMRSFFQRTIHESGDIYDVNTPCDANLGGPLLKALSAPEEWVDAKTGYCGDRNQMYGGGVAYPLPVHELIHHSMCRKARNLSYDTFPFKKAEAQYRNVEESDGTNTLTIDVQIHEASQIVIILPDTVTAWSLDHEIPPARTACKCHFILFIHGGSTSAPVHGDISLDGHSTHDGHPSMRSDRGWQLQVRNAHQVDIQAHYVDFRRVVPNFERPLPEHDIGETWPSWVTPITTYSQHLPSFRRVVLEDLKKNIYCSAE